MKRIYLVHGGGDFSADNERCDAKVTFDDNYDDEIGDDFEVFEFLSEYYDVPESCVRREED